MTISVVMGYLYPKSKISAVDHCRPKISDSSCGPASIQFRLYLIQFCYVCCLKFHVLWAGAYVNSIVVVVVVVVAAVVVVVVSKTRLKCHVCCCESMSIQALYVREWM